MLQIELVFKQMLERINVLLSLGLPIDNIKVHPHVINRCQPSALLVNDKFLLMLACVIYYVSLVFVY